MAPRTLEHRDMLFNLKKMVEKWFLMRQNLSSEVDLNGSNIELATLIEAIIIDGLRQTNGISYTRFLRDLKWSNMPAVVSHLTEHYKELDTSIHQDLKLWIMSCIEVGCLNRTLQNFVANRKLFGSYYLDGAFLWNADYATAFFIYVSAVENNQVNSIYQIDLSLYPERPAYTRFSSHPHFSMVPEKYSICNVEKYSETNSLLQEVSPSQNHIINSTFRRSNSLPNLVRKPSRTRERSKTISPPIRIPGAVTYSPEFRESVHQCVSRNDSCRSNSTENPQHNGANQSKTPDFIDIIPLPVVDSDNITIYLDQTQSQNGASQTGSVSDGTYECVSPPHSCSLNRHATNVFPPTFEQSMFETVFCASASAPSDLMCAFLPRDGEKLKTRYTRNVLDDAGHVTILNKSSSSTPLANQSLANFLQSSTFSRNNTDLERENAHFQVSETIIGIIEELKSSKLIDITETECSEAKEDGYSQHTLTKDESPDNKKSQKEANRSEDVTSNENKTAQNINDYVAYAEWGESTYEALSAEGVALSLISKFRDKNLPRVSDITWLVSEEDAPQKLLPLPGSPSSDSDEHFVHSFTRGTRDWAPPRQQVIFTDHLFPTRKKQMQKQNYRCAGCGMKVATVYINRYRYCTYLGKYHCSGCHRNQISLIPAKILEKWDFSYYPVSVFAYRLLEQIRAYPLFYVPDLNPSLYTKIKSLNMAKMNRIQLKFIQDFIKTCRFCQKEKTYFETIPSYWYLDPDKWAMSDFVAAKNGSFQKSLRNLIDKCEEHVFDCVLCTARGFICELCPKKQIIFPWQPKIKRCSNCGTCFHQNCWRNIPDCVKCQRLKMREQRIL